MNGSTDIRPLLEEIRDLLIPISRVCQGPYEDLVRREHMVDIEHIVAIVGKSAKRRAAVKAMDGSRDRKEIMQASAIDEGDLSKLIKRLRGENLVSEDGGKPQLTVVPTIIWEE